MERYFLLDLCYFSGSHVTLFSGFGFMCHVDEDRRKLHYKIDNFDFGTDKSVKLIYGGGESHLMNLAEWHKTSKSYYDRFFGCDLHKVVTIAPPGNNIVETLRKWCSKNHGKGIIAEGYDLIEHFNFLGVNSQHVSVLPQPECYQRIIVFNYSEKVIFIIHKVNKMGESLNGEFTCIRADIKLLVTLYKNELKGSGCKIIGLVVIKEDIQNLKMHCHICKIFIVSDKIFRTLKSLENWWQKFEQWCEMKELILYNANENLFTLISSKLLSFMASCQCLYLPNLTNIPASQVEQTHLLLTPEQIEVLYSSEAHVCIRGNFGTGKSILALKKVMLLSQTLKKNDVIYFVNYDQRSSFHREVEFHYKTKKQFKILHNTSHLKLSDIFMNIGAKVSNSIKNIHLFIDEFNIEDLTRSEATSLRYYLEQDIRFKYSCVWIIVQPVERNRIFVDSINGKHFSESVSFTELKDTLKVKDLTYVMRTTVQINKLAEVTKKFLENKQNHFKHSEMGSLKSKDSIGSHSEKTLNDNKEMSSLHGLCRVKFSDTRVIPNLESFDQVDPCSPLNLDEAFKQVSEGKLVPVLNDGAKVTMCCFKFMFSRIGHQIEGPRPNIFEPLQFTGKFENILAVGAMLKFLSIGKKKTAILHFEQYPPEIVLNATQLCHEGLEISLDVDKFKSLNCKSCIFISNFHYVRGMEFDNVIALVDPDEYYLKHDIVECILRCRQNLSIVMIKDKRLRPPEDTVQGMLDTWEKAGVAVRWNFAQCKVCDNTRYFHVDENAHTVYINMLSDEYCKMRESFKLMQDVINRDSRAEEVKVKTTAENL